MRNDSRSFPLLRRTLLALAVLGAAACSDDTPLQPGDDGGGRPTPAKTPLGVMEITISGIDTPEMTASALPLPPEASLAAGARGPSLTLSPAGGSPSGGIQLEPYSTGSFTDGTRGDGGVRYVHATFRVRNAATDGNAYNTQRKNLTFLAASTGSTIKATSISKLSRFDGSPANGTIAPLVIPTGAVERAPEGDRIITGPDVLQVFDESELVGIPVAPGIELLPYGFVVRHLTSTTTRTLPASPAANRFDGLVTFTFKIPLQATPAEDPFMVSAIFLAVDDSETRITQSLEEQTPEGTAAFLARAQALGATMKIVLPGAGSYWGNANSTRTICTVRTAGPSANPTATLVEREVASLVTKAIDWPLWSSGVALYGDIVVRDGGGTALTDVPLQFAFGTPGVLELGSSRQLQIAPRRERGSTTMSVEACGHASAPVTMRASGYSPLDGGWYYTLAIRSDGTVAAWGGNEVGETDVPAGLSNVVQVATNHHHSLALKYDGTVVAWGWNNYGQINVPSGLTDVVQIAAGFDHSLALRADGTVVGWGDMVGDIQLPNRGANVPSGLKDVVQIAAGHSHSLALKADGTVVAWGYNHFGETNVPPGLKDVVQVTAGERHSLALKADGTVVAWGWSNHGQAYMPSDLKDVVQVAAGFYHSLALKADGTVMAWGDKRIGGSNVGQFDVPAGLDNVVHIAAGRSHSLALKADGTVVAWGWNAYGQTDVPPSLVAAVP